MVISLVLHKGLCRHTKSKKAYYIVILETIIPHRLCKKKIMWHKQVKNFTCLCASVVIDFLYGRNSSEPKPGICMFQQRSVGDLAKLSQNKA